MRIIQLLDALDYGDGVSNDVINKYNLFKEMGHETLIYSKWANDRVDKYRNDIDLLNTKNDDILLHHFSGKSNILDKVLKAKGIKILVYHNITPSHFFNNDTKHKKLEEGENQLKDLFNKYNYFVADSEFNASCMRELGVHKKIDILPILIDFSEIDKFIANNTKIKNTSEITFLFVGRVAPNKKHEDIINIFNYYYKNINCISKLVFIGNYSDYEGYYNELQSKISSLNLSDSIAFTGKIDTEELYNYYLNSDVFLCMSEHEGFCIPLLESMRFGLPTIAFNAGAIKTTMGNAGILVNNKLCKAIAKLIHLILSSKCVNSKIIEKQNMLAETFMKESIKEKLSLLIKKWTGEKYYE